MVTHDLLQFRKKIGEIDEKTRGQRGDGAAFATQVCVQP